METNWKKALLWFIILVLIFGAMTIASYIVGQSYAGIAADQFNDYTESYRMLRTQGTIETIIMTVGIAGIVVCIIFIWKSFKFKKES
jgi:ABC-type spermidine/putrescine transport system permease subunit I